MELDRRGTVMTLDDIANDHILQLTAVMDRLFKVADCDPTCHCCCTVIKVGDEFKLAYHDALVRTGGGQRYEREERDIMLCGQCTIEDLKVMEKRKIRQLAQWRRDNPRAGYSRPHRRATCNN